MHALINVVQIETKLPIQAKVRQVKTFPTRNITEEPQQIIN